MSRRSGPYHLRSGRAAASPAAMLPEATPTPSITSADDEDSDALGLPSDGTIRHRLRRGGYDTQSASSGGSPVAPTSSSPTHARRGSISSGHSVEGSGSSDIDLRGRSVTRAPTAMIVRRPGPTFAIPFLVPSPDEPQQVLLSFVQSWPPTHMIGSIAVHLGPNGNIAFDAPSTSIVPFDPDRHCDPINIRTLLARSRRRSEYRKISWPVWICLALIAVLLGCRLGAGTWDHGEDADRDNGPANLPEYFLPLDRSLLELLRRYVDASISPIFDPIPVHLEAEYRADGQSGTMLFHPRAAFSQLRRLMEWGLCRHARVYSEADMSTPCGIYAEACHTAQNTIIELHNHRFLSNLASQIQSSQLIFEGLEEEAEDEAAAADGDMALVERMRNRMIRGTTNDLSRYLDDYYNKVLPLYQTLEAALRAMEAQEGYIVDGMVRLIRMKANRDKDWVPEVNQTLQVLKSTYHPFFTSLFDLYTKRVPSALADARILHNTINANASAWWSQVEPTLLNDVWYNYLCAWFQPLILAGACARLWVLEPFMFRIAFTDMYDSIDPLERLKARNYENKAELEFIPDQQKPKASWWWCNCS